MQRLVHELDIRTGRFRQLLYDEDGNIVQIDGQPQQQDQQDQQSSQGQTHTPSAATPTTTDAQPATPSNRPRQPTTQECVVCGKQVAINRLEVHVNSHFADDDDDDIDSGEVIIHHGARNANLDVSLRDTRPNPLQVTGTAFPRTCKMCQRRGVGIIGANGKCADCSTKSQGVANVQATLSCSRCGSTTAESYIGGMCESCHHQKRVLDTYSIDESPELNDAGSEFVVTCPLCQCDVPSSTIDAHIALDHDTD